VDLIMPLYERPHYLGLTRPAWWGVAVGLLLLSGLLYGLVNLGPRRVPVAVGPSGLNAAQWQLSREIDDIEQHCKKLPTEGVPAPEMEHELVRAIVLQRKLLGGALSSDQAQMLRLERLEEARDTVRARRVWPRVQELEVQLSGDLAEADKIKVLSELLALRRDINRSQADARYKDLVREAQVERDLGAAQARPLRAEADAETAKAQAAAARSDWPDALAHYSRARVLMANLNLNFSRTRYADNGLQARLATEEEALQGAQEWAQITVYVKGGDAAAAAGEGEAADTDYSKAMVLQTRLNERWPRSRFVSTTDLESWDRKRQTVLAGAALAKLREQDAVAAGLLAQRRVLAAVTQIMTIREELDKLGAKWPKSQHHDEGLARKYIYLATLTDTLRGLQDGVYDRLVPLPGSDRLMLLRTEMPQGLYTQVMKINPSRTRDDRRPVESLTWMEAQEFCRRLSWVLGRPVRLPSLSEFDQAGGGSENKAAGNKATPHKIVDVATDAANTNGYSDLNGNVAEWLAAAEAARDAPVATGPAAMLPKDTRSPDLGFRVLVEVKAE
jgi:hypothetical protein